MKKFFFICCAAMCALSVSAKNIYLVPNNNWKSSDARFAVYAFNDEGNTWVDMTATEDDANIYAATIDDQYTTIIFCRMNPEKTENNWNDDTKWTQTGNIVLSDLAENANVFSLLPDDTWTDGFWYSYEEGPAYKLSYGHDGEEDWQSADFVRNQGEHTASFTLSIAKDDTYSFKVYTGNYWFGDGMGGTMERENCTGWTLYTNTQNVNVKADVTGEYKFIWDYVKYQISVVYPSSTPTAVVAADDTNDVVSKIVRNGQVLIQRNGVTYTMTGQEVK